MERKMKTLVTYSSQTGNTLKLAQKIYDTIKGERDIFPMDQFYFTCYNSLSFYTNTTDEKAD
jgi:flavodoxin